MNKLKNHVFYFCVIIGFSSLLYYLFQSGAVKEVGRIINAPDHSGSQWGHFIDTLLHNLSHPLALLLAQIVTIIFVARIFSWICRRIGQPAVIGEIAAGIFLGPSFIGTYLPEFSQALFPPESLSNLQFLSQIGLILFMFIVGMELDLNTLKKRANDAFVISQVGIIVPFTFGVALAFYIYHTLAPRNIPFISFGLFMGIALSIAAFPVLARIVQERGLHKTRFGSFVITCAAFDDFTAWCILAVVIAVVKAGSFVSSVYIILLAISYVIVMLTVVRPFLKRVGELHPSRENLSKPIVAIFFLTLILSAYATEIIGIHALFGAFMAGTMMPDNMKFRSLLVEKIEDVALVLLLPLFFVYTGLRTQIGLLSEPEHWMYTGLIILVAVSGKFLGTSIAARVVGQNWRDSLSIGALMNSRGLMELVVLNIGYDLGVLSPEIFAMMVIMALVTTFMAGPALDLITRFFPSAEDIIVRKVSKSNKYKILISFANPEKGRTLLRLAHSFVKGQDKSAAVTVMHLSPDNELSQLNIDEYEQETFAPVVEDSHQLNQKITTLFKVSADIRGDISEVANKGDYDLLLLGIGQSIYKGSLLGRILGFTTKVFDPHTLINAVKGKDNLVEKTPFEEFTRFIVSKTDIPVGILVDRGLVKVENVLVPMVNLHDFFILDYIQKLVENSGVHIHFVDTRGNIKKMAEFDEALASLEQIYPGHILIQNDHSLSKIKISQFDLVLLSLDSWKMMLEKQNSWLIKAPSTLILKP